MEIKDFIAETISQINDGCIEAQKKIEGAGSIVNPKFSVKDQFRSYLATNDDLRGRQEITEINFEINLATVSNESEKGGIGVEKIIVAGTSRSKEKSDSISHRITFKIPVVFQPGNQDQERARPYVG